MLDYILSRIPCKMTWVYLNPVGPQTQLKYTQMTLQLSSCGIQICDQFSQISMTSS